MSKLADHIFWLNLTEKGKDNLLDIIRKLQLPETLDELGLGVLRDYFADLFFPGTTTVMTRARYFMFIPAIYYYFEKHNIKIGAEDIRKKQDELREKLVRYYKRSERNNKKEFNGEGQGIIGTVAKERLLRWPDEIYWNGMVTLEIFERADWSRDYYTNLLSKQEEKLYDDDNNIQGELGLLNTWNFPYEELEDIFYGRKNCFRDDISLDLTNKESIYLKQKLIKRSDSLYPTLLERSKVYGEDIFWDMPGIIKKNRVEDAKRFSLFSRGLWLIYYYLLQQKKKRDDEADKFYKLFVKWHMSVKNELKQWNFDSFINNIKDDKDHNKSVIRYMNFRFLEETYRNIVATNNCSKIISNNEEHIVKREKRTKGNRARLSNDDALVEWDGKITVNTEKLYHYDYRWERPVKYIINDIIRGLHNVQT